MYFQVSSAPLVLHLLSGSLSSIGCTALNLHVLSGSLSSIGCTVLNLHVLTGFLSSIGCTVLNLHVLTGLLSFVFLLVQAAQDVAYFYSRFLALYCLYSFSDNCTGGFPFLRYIWSIVLVLPGSLYSIVCLYSFYISLYWRVPCTPLYLEYCTNLYLQVHCTLLYEQYCTYLYC